MNRTAFIIVFFALLIGSCSDEKKPITTPNWPEELKVMIVKDCEKTAMDQIDSAKVPKFCDCMLGKIMEQYPDTTDLRAAGKEKVMRNSMKMALKCMFK